MKRCLAVSAAALMSATTAIADPWSVLVLGNDGDAIALSSSLSGAGIADVRHMLDGAPRDYVDAIKGMAGSDRVAIYYNGPLVERGGQPAIGNDPRLTMAALADTLAAGGARQVAILVENCGSAGAGAAIASPIGSLRSDLLLAASAGPGQSCSGPVLTNALSGADLTTPLEDIVAANWIGVAPTDTMSLDPGAGAAPAAVAFLEPQAEGINVAAAPDASETQAIVFAAVNTGAIAAIPIAAGFPQPSITIGIIPEEPEALTEVAAVVGETDAEEAGAIGEISWDDFEARVAFRDEQPDLFGTLVETGAFDPPEAELALAIQTELKRMDCYTSLLDGDFGRGSRRAVTNYYDEAGLGTPPSTDPTAELFRVIIAAEDVTCPPPPAPAPVASTSSAPRSTSSGSSSAAPRPAPTPAPAPAPAPSSSGRTIQSGGGGIGVFR